MTKKEFIYLLQNSFKITLDGYDNSIFHVWNKSIERQLKYNRLFNVNKSIKYSFNKKDILFEQDLKNMYLWYNHDNIYLKLIENIDYKNLNINTLIDGWLKDDTNWKQYTPNQIIQQFDNVLKDDTNWKQYTPHILYQQSQLKYDTNWKLYTPQKYEITYSFQLKDDTNWKQIH